MKYEFVLFSPWFQSPGLRQPSFPMLPGQLHLSASGILGRVEGLGTTTSTGTSGILGPQTLKTLRPKPKNLMLRPLAHEGD